MNQSIVSCHLEGQLGNQFFTIAATLAYAWDYGAKAVFPELNESRYRLDWNRDRVFFRLNPSMPSQPMTQQFWEKIWFSPERIPYTPENLTLFGYFHSWRHFHHHRERLLEIFAPRADILQSIREKYSQLLSHPNKVAIHVRTSMRKAHGILPFLGIDYVKDSLKEFPKDAKFIVFSDRINWCKHHLSDLGVDMTFMEGNDAVEDLLLMSMMDHQVIANSTFSWWGAYLNQNPNKKIVAPSITSTGASTEHLYFPEWTILPIKVQPYPDDMYDYDKLSQSLDNNE